MIINIIFGFIIPWIFGYILYTKDKRVLLHIAPFASALSYTVNIIGFKSHFWRLVPTYLYDLASLPFNIGLFAILPCYLIYFISKENINSCYLVVIFSTLMTLLEYIGVLFGRIIYYNGWNLVWTFLSYLIPYFIVYLYYLILRNNETFFRNEV